MTPARVAYAEPNVSTQQLPLDFSWTAPDTCPTRAEVIAELTKAVDAGGKQLPPLSARAVVQQDGGTWRLELTTEMDGIRGTRILEADSCAGLARAATLVLALTLGEGLARRLQAEAKARDAPPPPAPPPPERAPGKPSPPAPARSDASYVLLWASGAVGSDPLGGFGPALVFGVGFQPSVLRFGTRLEATFPRSTEFAGSGGYVRSLSFSADLQACLAPTWRPFQFALCADGGLTLLDAKGQGTARDSDASVPLYGLGPSVSALWLLHDHAFLNLGVTSRFFLKRPELVVEGLPQRRRVEALAIGTELGLGVRW